jgi:pimeloyl-ACP methyl ester carboxylesterase
MRAANTLRVATGDIELSVTEWRGTGDPKLLLHATGFHSHCWHQVAKRLPQRHLFAADLRFHGASGKTGQVNWQLMAEDVRTLIQCLDLSRLVGVGHSIGGYLMAQAAARLPQRFKHVILIDPVIMSPLRYQQFYRETGNITAATHPVSRRKNSWRDADEMYQRFECREPFSTWQPDVLRDYCDHALRPAVPGSHHQLACDPLDEAGIYLNQHGNDIILQELHNIVSPVTLLRAAPADEQSMDLSRSPTWPGLANALPVCKEIYLPHMNHFIPMQDPALIADCIAAVQ